MKISEVIKKLQEIQNEHGDVQVYHIGEDYVGHLDVEMFNDVFNYNKTGVLYVR